MGNFGLPLDVSRVLLLTYHTWASLRAGDGDGDPGLGCALAGSLSHTFLPQRSLFRGPCPSCSLVSKCAPNQGLGGAEADTGGCFSPSPALRGREEAWAGADWVAAWFSLLTCPSPCKKERREGGGRHPHSLWPGVAFCVGLRPSAVE